MDFLMFFLCLGILEIDLWQIRISLYVCVSTPGIVCSLGSSVHTVPYLKSILCRVNSNKAIHSKSFGFELPYTLRSLISNLHVRYTSCLRIQTFLWNPNTRLILT